jgi:ferredoxin--NADP+ reductase
MMASCVSVKPYQKAKLNDAEMVLSGRTTEKYGIRTVVSMNPIMIDGTGMCGGCRLLVGGETKFACVDGPEFDGHLVDFDAAMERAALYKDFEREADCNLLRQEVQD